MWYYIVILSQVRTFKDQLNEEAEEFDDIGHAGVEDSVKERSLVVIRPAEHMYYYYIFNCSVNCSFA